MTNESSSQRLSVFAGGCTLDAAEAVVAGDGIDALDVLDHLATLVRRSLVVADQDGDQTRYRLLETIRQYAQDRLEESGDAHTTNRRHTEHYARLAEEAAPHLRGREQLEWIARLAPEIDNLRVALLRGLDHDDLDLALALVVSVCVNGIAIGYLALAWAELAAANPAVDTRPLGPALLAQAAWNAIMRGELERARDFDRRRVDGEATLGLAPNPANFQAPATIALFSNEPEIGREHARAWVATARAADDGYETVQGLTMLSATLSGSGDIAGAVHTMEEAVAEARRQGTPSNLSFALMTYGLQLNVAEQPARAIPVLEEAVAVGIEVGNQQGVAARAQRLRDRADAPRRPSRRARLVPRRTRTAGADGRTVHPRWGPLRDRLVLGRIGRVRGFRDARRVRRSRRRLPPVRTLRRHAGSVDRRVLDGTRRRSLRGARAARRRHEP